MSLARVQFFSISLDGFGTGEGQSHKAPFGHAGEKLHQWQFATQWWREMTGQAGGSNGIDNAFVQLHDRGIGADREGGLWRRCSRASRHSACSRSSWRQWS